MAQILIQARDRDDGATVPTATMRGDVISVHDDGVMVGRAILSNPDDWTSPPIMEADGIPRSFYIVDIPTKVRGLFTFYKEPVMSAELDPDGVPIGKVIRPRVYRFSLSKLPTQAQKTLRRVGRLTITEDHLIQMREARQANQ